MTDQQSSLSAYAGDIPADAAWRILADDPRAVLIDVRTAPEWTFVGGADLSSLDKQPIRLSWQIFPAMNVNPTFVAEISAAGVPNNAPILLLCRSGVRSRAAAIALTTAGFEPCYNIVDGFEGQLDESRHRGRGGWKALNLPWIQS